MCKAIALRGKYNNKALMCIGEGVIRAILLAFVGFCVGACLLNFVLVRNFVCFGVVLVRTVLLNLVEFGVVC